MISDSERREVARKLRGIREDEYGEVYVYDVMLALGIESGKAAYWADKEFVHHLADLIDRPTCEMGGVRYAICSRCGAFVRRDAVTDCCGVIPVRFCANCGAEVVHHA